MNAFTRNALAAMLVLLLPAAATAQDAAAPESTQEACTVELLPVQSGGQVQVTATFNRPFGEVTEIKGPEKSGLKVVKVVEAKPSGMAAEGGDEEAPAEQPAELTGNVAKFRINTADMEPGTYDVTLTNADEQHCSGELTIERSASGDDEW